MISWRDSLVAFFFSTSILCVNREQAMKIRGGATRFLKSRYDQITTGSQQPHNRELAYDSHLPPCLDCETNVNRCHIKSKSKKALFNVGQCKQYNISSHLKWVLVADTQPALNVCGTSHSRVGMWQGGWPTCLNRLTNVFKPVVNFSNPLTTGLKTKHVSRPLCRGCKALVTPSRRIWGRRVTGFSTQS